MSFGKLDAIKAPRESALRTFWGAMDILLRARTEAVKITTGRKLWMNENKSKKIVDFEGICELKMRMIPGSMFTCIFEIERVAGQELSCRHPMTRQTAGFATRVPSVHQTLAGIPRGPSP